MFYIPVLYHYAPHETQKVSGSAAAQTPGPGQLRGKT